MSAVAAPAGPPLPARARQAGAQAAQLARAREAAPRYGLLGTRRWRSGCIRIGRAAAHAHVLQITRIVVRGNDRLSKGEVLAVLSGLQGQSLVWTNLDAGGAAARVAVGQEAALQAIAAVHDRSHRVRAAAERSRPHQRRELYSWTTRRAHRSVRPPVCGPRSADRRRPRFAQGRRIDDGPGAGRSRDARHRRPAEASRRSRRRVSQLDVSDLHNATVILSGDPAVIQLGDDQFLPRLQSYLDLAAALRQRVPDIDYVDLRFDDRIYVRPASAPWRCKAGAGRLPGAARASTPRTRGPPAEGPRGRGRGSSSSD